MQISTKTKPWIVIVLVLPLWILISCQSSVKAKTSQDISESKDRVEFLEQYLNFKTPVLDAEFYLYDVNDGGSRLVPGATHRDFRIFLRLTPDNLALWTKDYPITSFPVDTSWMEAIPLERQSIKWDSPRLMYSQEGFKAISYTDEGYLFLHFEQL